jgi:predicted  nucleic acid-binding Zn-ribbon protein
MLAKGKSERQEEQVRFAAYKQFCDDTTEEKKASIASAADEIESLQADIQKAESDAAVLAKDIAELDADVAKYTSQQKEATAVREKEHDDFQTEHKDYSESLDALDRAIIVLKKKSFDVEQATALLQQVSLMVRVPEKARRTIAAFLATDSEIRQDPLSVSAPEAAGYEFQSGGVVDMLENLKEKFEDELRDLEKEEMNAEHAYELMSVDLKASIKQADGEMNAKAKIKSEKEEAAAEAKGDLADTTAAQKEDSTYLSELGAQCTQKSADFESRQQLRSEELEAIQKAIEILSSGVAGRSEKYGVALVQSKAKASAMALRATAVKGQTPGQRSVALFLQGRAKQLGSRILAMVAQKVNDDPFAKVKKMIDGMITKLLAEANEEADHKGWCDTEMATNKNTRDKKTEELNTLHAQIDQLTADITTLAQEIADLSAGIAELDKAIAEATEVRQKESAKNKETIEDAKEAQTAVTQALAVLKEFYAKAATATALVQCKQPEVDAPATFDSPYTGMGGESTGVVGMLEVIQSDFAKLEAETGAAEDTAAKEHRRFMAESSKDKAVKETDLDHKKKTKVSKESDLNDANKDRFATERELNAALAYYDKLKPSCVDSGVTYDERVARREEEIESLREALRILSME